MSLRSDLLDVPGRRRRPRWGWRPWRRLERSLEAWCEEQVVRFDGQRVFSGKPGMADIFVVDAEAGRYLMTQPDSAGALNSNPALRVVKGVMAARRADFSGALELAVRETSEGLCNLEGFALLPAVHRLSGEIVFRWLLGQGGPPGRWLLQSARRETPEELHEILGSSPSWPIIDALSDEHDVPTEGRVERVFAALRRAIERPARALFSSLLALDLAPDVRKRVASREASTDDLARVMAELLRLFSASNLTVYRARRPFELPTQSGVAYRIEDGDTLGYVRSVALRDPETFPDPDLMNPDRYHDASVRLLNYSMSDPSDVELDASTEMQDILRSTLSAWVREHTWTLEPTPVLHRRPPLFAGPESIRMTGFRRRGRDE